MDNGISIEWENVDPSNYVWNITQNKNLFPTYTLNIELSPLDPAVPSPTLTVPLPVYTLGYGEAIGDKTKYENVGSLTAYEGLVPGKWKITVKHECNFSKEQLSKFCPGIAPDTCRPCSGFFPPDATGSAMLLAPTGTTFATSTPTSTSASSNVSTPPPNNSSSSTTSNTPLIAGIAGGVVVLLAVIGAVAFFAFKRRQNDKLNAAAAATSKPAIYLGNGSGGSDAGSTKDQSVYVPVHPEEDMFASAAGVAPPPSYDHVAAVVHHTVSNAGGSSSSSSVVGGFVTSNVDNKMNRSALFDNVSGNGASGSNGDVDSYGYPVDRKLMPGRENYVLGEEIADKIAEVLQTKLDSGVYDNYESLEVLAKTLTEDLRSINGDKHLGVAYEPEITKEEEPLLTMLDPPDAEISAGEAESMNLFACGFNDVRRLAGNVGYISMRYFPSATKQFKHILAGVFDMLSGTHALIIDMRNNGGGDGMTSDLLISYLTDEKVDLAEIYWKNTDERVVTSTNDVDGPRYLDKPVYVLTSQETFSAAEKFAVCIQALHRAQTVGDKTAGGGYPCYFYRAGHDHLSVSVSIGITKCVLTGKGWQGVGAPADIPCDPKDAMDVAHLRAAKHVLEVLEKLEGTSEMTSSKLSLLRETRKAVKELEEKLNVGGEDEAKGEEAKASADNASPRVISTVVPIKKEDLIPGTYYNALPDGNYEKVVIRNFSLFGMTFAPKLVYASKITKERYESENAVKEE
ncbi:hypothetical protein HDU76_004136 [Blyttiomyces sp. JEL0837]|nr:hypothetical protein HDU76_004136 [Blyttiomyces sp. JEL0837]